jgi:4-hydroxy-tetrahydrodipicolinate synthase
MVQPPACSLPGAEEVFAFFTEVAAAVKLPIMAYNIPKRAGVSMSPQLIARLADIDEVVAIKQSSGSFDELVETIMLAGPRLRVFAGYSAKRGLPSTVMGADGYVTSTEPQVFGKEGIDLWRLSLLGRYEEARAIQFRSVRLGQAIWEGKGTFPAPIKAAMNLLGRPGGHPRPPIKPLGPEGTAHLRQVLRELGLLS